MNRRIIIALLIVSGLMLGLPVRAQVVLNEVVSLNTQFEDPEGGFHDWIELYNPSSYPINLSDYFLSDDAADLYFWQLPDVNIPPYGYFVLFASGDADPVRVPISISGNGESLYLTHADEQETQSVEIPPLQANHSYGWSTADEAWRYYASPTPGSVNDGLAYLGYSNRPTAAYDSGFYTDSVEIIILPPNSEGTIYFTTDGSLPTAQSSVYSNPFVVNSTTVLKAIYTIDNHLPSAAITSTYFINEHPSLPVVSLAVHPDSLFHPETGLYMDGPNAEEAWPHYGANYWSERGIRVSVEYFKDGHRKIAQDAELTIHGGKSSRNKPQRPLRLTAMSEYGSGYFEYPIFAQKPQVTEFKHLILRNSGADFLSSNFRDGYWHQLAHNQQLNIDYFGFTPTVVFINGEYWGIMSLREKVSEYYAAANGNAHADSVIIGEINNEKPFVGDTVHYAMLTQFMLNQDLSDQLNYQYVADQLDINNFIDYYALEIFAGNPDWPANNIKFWKPSVNSGKWRYIMFDFDTTMLLYNWILYNFDMFQWVFEEKEAALHSRLFVRLLENAEFKRLFINRLADLMNTSFEYAPLDQNLESITSLFEPEIERHFNRWDGDLELWNTQVDNIIPGFISERRAHVRSQVNDHFELSGQVMLNIEVYPPQSGKIQLNTLLAEPPFSGIYFAGNEVELTVIPEAGMEFSHWSFTGGWLSAPQNAAIREDFRTSGTLTAVFKHEEEETFQVLNNGIAGVPLELQFQAFAKCEGHLIVRNTHGQIVREWNVFLEEGDNFIHPQPGSLSEGVYLITLRCAEQEHTVKWAHL
ncbi:MAG: CotH kinase family protein [Flavobacteriales bacterium]|nr:CotH kinase family protein [Flavobacteriales bacterium]